MSVNQTTVNNLATSIETKLLRIAYSYASRQNNAVKSTNVDKDIIRLWQLLKILESYDVTASYFDEEYILHISDEWKRYCGFKEGMLIDQQPTPVSLEQQNLNLRKFRVYRHNTTSTLIGNEQSTGFTLPETPLLYTQVKLNGFPLDIGDGTKSRECYFSDDLGSTAKSLAGIDKDDVLYINVIVLGLANIVVSDQFLIEVI